MINNSKILRSWFLTVVIGSIGLILIYLLGNFLFEKYFYIGSDFISQFFYAILLTILTSALISLPTIVTLLIANGQFKKQNLNFKFHFKKVNKIHLFMAIFTLSVMEGIVIYNIIDSYNYYKKIDKTFNLLDSNYLSIMLAVFGVWLWFALCATFIWFLVFKKEIRTIKQNRLQE